MLRLRTLFPKMAHLNRQVMTTPCLSHEDLFVHRDTMQNNPRTVFDFTAPNQKRIEALMLNYPIGYQRSVISSAIDIVQRQMGWVPISAMHKVADMLCIPRVRVYEWCTFYTMVNRRPRGKYHIKVCSTTPCMIRGAEEILRAAEEAACCTVGGISANYMFGVDTVECSGACANAPVVIINDDYYEDLTTMDICNIINTIRCGDIPPCGPQSGRFAAEPITGLTSLLSPPPCPGFGLQPGL